MSLADRLAEWLPILWFLFVGLLVLAFWNTGLIPGLIQRTRRFGGFGVEFEFNEPTARQTRDTIEGHLDAIRRTIRRELEADVRAKSLQHGLKLLLEASQLNRHDGYRATIHIPDPLYDNSLYQLLDYHPRGVGHGRTFSGRAGLIGLVWRKDSHEEWDSTRGISLSELIQQWGMTHREAAQRRVLDKTRVMLGISLHDRAMSRQLGVLYLDSEERDYFGSTKADRDALVAELEALYLERLADPLSALVEKAMLRSPQLSLEESL